MTEELAQAVSTSVLLQKKYPTAMALAEFEASHVCLKFESLSSGSDERSGFLAWISSGMLR